jgi:hypothetical protein
MMHAGTYKSLLTALLILTAFSLSAQDSIPTLSAKPRNQDNFWRRVNIGGNLGFQFGTITGITVSPEVAIRTVDQLYVGFRFIYQYYYYRDCLYDRSTGQWIDYSSNLFGGGVFLRYYLSSLFDNMLGNFFAHTEYEYQYYTQPFVEDPNGMIEDPYSGMTFSRGKQGIEINSIFIGGGYRQKAGGRVFIDLLILFNLNDSYYSPYTNPVFRIGIGAGL